MINKRPPWELMGIISPHPFTAEGDRDQTIYDLRHKYPSIFGSDVSDEEVWERANAIADEQWLRKMEQEARCNEPRLITKIPKKTAIDAMREAVEQDDHG